MKITVETKFEVGQEVFYIVGGRVAARDIRDVFLGPQSYVVYTFLTFPYTCGEHQLYATHQEAYAELCRQKKANLAAAIQQIKRDARSITHNYVTADCMDDATLLSAKRVIRRFSDDLGKILKGGTK